MTREQCRQAARAITDSVDDPVLGGGIPSVDIHDTFTDGMSQGERLATKEKRDG